MSIVEGYRTQFAARRGAVLVSHPTPRDAERVSAVLGRMQPPKSGPDRPSEALPARREAQRETFEATVRKAGAEVPETVRAVVVPLGAVSGAARAVAGAFVLLLAGALAAPGSRA